ncbi:hypothetical protein K438DRAFT_1751510 [Mycena galopus ATCC 62051]|nr:hypothetical protein K438DRAFT_1751510 [Mycena galopus ATCC 62051]
MDHYTTARFEGMKEERKGDSRGLREAKAGKPGEKCRRLGEVQVFNKSGHRTEDGSRVRRPEYSDVGGSVKTTENDRSNSGGPKRSGEDWNVKLEEDGGEQMITGSHPVVVRMSSRVEPEVYRHRPGVGRELTGGYWNVYWSIPEVVG